MQTSPWTVPFLGLLLMLDNIFNYVLPSYPSSLSRCFLPYISIIYGWQRLLYNMPYI